MSAENEATYQVLARQWRPKQFTDVVWQTHVTQALENALTAKRLHHAYLFTGTRGVGKTTLARIMAKCLSCLEGISATPCDQCAHCTAINQGQFMDLIEVDAASRTRVEDTRELLENAHYAPTQGRFKIYLIDEVHMLSAHSFNALLKTLEEPPEHVKFLFATTDPQRLPATLLSRCLQFHLKAIPEVEISKQLKNILTKENIRVENEALKILAHAAQGSLRDGLSLLDQVIDHSQQQVTALRTRQLLGLANPDLVLDILQAVIEAQPQTALISLQQCREQNTDLTAVIDQLLAFTQILAVAKLVPTHLDNHPQQERLAVLLKHLNAEEIQLYYQILLYGRRDLAFVPIIEHAVQMTIIRLFAFQPSQPTALTISAANEQPTHVASNVKHPVEAQPLKAVAPPPAVTKTPSVQASPNKKPAATAPTPSALTRTYTAEDWSTLVYQLPISGITATLAKHCQCELWEGAQIKLLLDPSHAAFLSSTQNSRLEEAITEYTGQPSKCKIEIARGAIDTPASEHQGKKQQAIDQTSIAMHADENMQQFMAAFDAKIAPDSIEPKS